MSLYKRIAITTGDVDGIGLEVTVKALQKIGPKSKTQLILFRALSSPTFRLPKFDRIQVLSLAEALEIKPNHNQLIEVVRADSPALWVEDVAKACFHKKLDSMVTGPLSKQEVHKAGLNDVGHTDILKRVCGSQTSFMTFIGAKFSVLLVTGHKPVAEVEDHLSKELIERALQVAAEARVLLPGQSSKKPLGILGLNPHAGDKGIIGHFDQSVLEPLIKKIGRKLGAQGPLVPDVAFLPENWKRYSFYVAQYHDQGLIPFKLVHGFDTGVHLTLGLPIRRSSVDHGTAKDLFGKNKANPGSMIEAINWGVRLAHKG